MSQQQRGLDGWKGTLKVGHILVLPTFSSVFTVSPTPTIFSSIFRKDEDPENKIEFKTRLGE